jgi:GNAT superfamily N-acetyltransferase
MSEVVLREATLADVDAIFAMAHELAVFEELEASFVAKPEDYERALFGSESPATVILAEIDGDPVAMALYIRTFSTFLGRTGIWLEDLFVREHARRRGIASLLLEELRRRSPGRVEWEVLDWNQGAIELYERAGATPFTGWTKYRIQPS